MVNSMASCHGWSQDLAIVKDLKYMLYSMSEALVPAIGDGEYKSMHGIFHPQLARLMCPHQDVEEFDENPEA